MYEKIPIPVHILNEDIFSLNLLCKLCVTENFPNQKDSIKHELETYKDQSSLFLFCSGLLKFSKCFL